MSLELKYYKELGVLKIKILFLQKREVEIEDVLSSNFDKNIIIDITHLDINCINCTLLAEILTTITVKYRLRGTQKIIILGKRKNLLDSQISKTGLTLVWANDFQTALEIIKNFQKPI